MNTLTAHTLAHAYIRANGSGVLRGDYGRVVTAYNTLADSGHEDYFDLAERLRATYGFVIANYDERGHFVGRTSGEDGWTA